MDYPLTIKEISSQKVTLKDNDNNLIYLPKDKLPREITIGQLINLQINFDSTSHDNLAKEILNELLGQ